MRAFRRGGNAKMIRYQLVCDQGHDFEGWFGSSADYDDQCARGLLSCPQCASADIEKAIMAPSVKRADKAAATMIETIRNDIANNCDDVGDNFVREARAMHKGEKPARAIYGQASRKAAKALVEDGVPILPLPEIFNPNRAKKKLN